MTDFLHKDPTRAIIEIKEILYGRLQVLRTCVANMAQDEDGKYIDPFDIQMGNEIQFLECLLDKIERST